MADIHPSRVTPTSSFHVTGVQPETVAMRHFKHAKAAKVATACKAHHQTFGGRCLNCGFDPAEVEG